MSVFCLGMGIKRFLFCLLFVCFLFFTVLVHNHIFVFVVVHFRFLFEGSRGAVLYTGAYHTINCMRMYVHAHIPHKLSLSSNT